MSYDDDRRHLAESLEGAIGDRAASTLMSYLPPVPWTELATKADISELRAELKSDFADLKNDFAGLRGEFADLKGEFAELKGEFKGIVPKLVVANLGMAGALFGLVAAAVAVFG